MVTTPITAVFASLNPNVSNTHSIFVCMSHPICVIFSLPPLKANLFALIVWWINTQTLTQIDTDRQADRHARTHTHTHTRAHARTHTHTHTHTTPHIHSLSPSLFSYISLILQAIQVMCYFWKQLQQKRICKWMKSYTLFLYVTGKCAINCRHRNGWR